MSKPNYLIKVKILGEKKSDAQVFESGEVLVGRSLDADLIFSWKGVSRQHALIRQREGQVFIKDLNSKGGVEINGQLIEAGRDFLYKIGDQIKFGSLETPVTIELVQTNSLGDDVRTDNADVPQLGPESVSAPQPKESEPPNRAIIEKSMSFLSRISFFGSKSEKEAQEKANLIVETAKARAERIIENAQWKAENIILRAKKKAEEIEAKAEKKADKGSDKKVS